MEKVKIYSLPTCHHCRQAKEFLSRKGVEYVEFDISKDGDALDEMTRISGYFKCNDDVTPVDQLSDDGAKNQSMGNQVSSPFAVIA